VFFDILKYIFHLPQKASLLEELDLNGHQSWNGYIEIPVYARAENAISNGK
jgi:hypothetical protein